MKWIVTIISFVFAVFTYAQDYTISNNEIKISVPVVFETGSGKLKPESESAIEIIVKALQSKTYISTLRVEGHTDNSISGTKALNLTCDRAINVCKVLIAKGVDCKRLIAVGFGDTKPVADNSTMEGKSENRRITFVIAALRGKAIGGMPLDGGGKFANDNLSLCNTQAPN